MTQRQQQEPVPDQAGEQATVHNGSSLNGAVPETKPGLYRRFKLAAKALKREVLALYYAMQDPRTGVLPRLLGIFVLAYALSPVDLIPDFIPILGIIDDLLLLPGIIWLALRLIPPEVREDSRRRAAEEPLKLSKNWAAACLIFAMWDALLCWLLWLGCNAWGPPELQQRLWWVVGGCAAVLMVAEGTWVVWQLRKERRKRSRAGVSGMGCEEAGALEEGLLGGDGNGAGGQA